MLPTVVLIDTLVAPASLPLSQPYSIIGSSLSARTAEEHTAAGLLSEILLFALLSNLGFIYLVFEIIKTTLNNL